MFISSSFWVHTSRTSLTLDPGVLKYESNHRLTRVHTSLWTDTPFLSAGFEASVDSLVRWQSTRVASQQAPGGLAPASLTRWAHGYEDLDMTTSSTLPRRCKRAPRQVSSLSLEPASRHDSTHSVSRTEARDLPFFRLTNQCARLAAGASIGKRCGSTA